MDVREGGSAWGMTYHHLDQRINRQKNNKNIIRVGLRWLLIRNFIRNNQPKTCGNGTGGNRREHVRGESGADRGGGLIPSFWGQCI